MNNGDMSPAPPRQPQLLRFRLRQMFLSVTLLCGLMALMVLTQGATALAIGGLLALIGAHVFATFVGTRLRDSSEESVRWQSSHPSQDADPLPPHAKPRHLDR